MAPPERRSRLPAPDTHRQDRHRQREIAHGRLTGVKLPDQPEQPQRCKDSKKYDRSISHRSHSDFAHSATDC